MSYTGAYLGVGACLEHYGICIRVKSINGALSAETLKTL